MRKRKREQERSWEIGRLTATPAAFGGIVDAPDEKSAIEAAQKDKAFKIRPQDRNRLIAVRHQ